jgi:stearoyl-CoA desaturase (delta-9 desaturase)
MDYRIDRGRAVAFLAVHALALLAPFTFTWAGLTAALLLLFATGQLGVCLGYHRLLAHRGFATPSVLRYLLAILGTLALQGGPLTWCAIHRRHHRHADHPADPQQSHSWFLRSHFLWTLAPLLGHGEEFRKIVRDLERETLLRWLERSGYALNVVVALALFVAGWGSADWRSGFHSSSGESGSGSCISGTRRSW